VVAIACDPIEDSAKLQAQVPAITVLTDLDKIATQAWGMLPAGGDEPDAGTFVVRRDGTITFRRLGDDLHGDWPSYGDLLAAVSAP